VEKAKTASRSSAFMKNLMGVEAMSLSWVCLRIAVELLDVGGIALFAFLDRLFI
jgi:hypothetical protein